MSRPRKEREPPLRVAAAPLHELGRDPLSVFLYYALLPEETRAVVKELGLSVPGFRAASLGDVERCDVIADEIRARPEAAAPVLAALDAAFGAPPLARHPLDPASADALLRLAAHEAPLALAAWRVLSDRAADVRRAAEPVLEELARSAYGAPAGGAGGEGGKGEAARGGREAGGPEDPASRAERLERDLETERRRREEAEAGAERRAEELRRRAEEQREKLQAALREARARESRLAGDAARSREEGEAARREAAAARAELEALRAGDAVADAQRARAEARDAAARADALASRLERARERERDLERDLEAAQRARPAPAGAPAAAPGPPEEEAAEELASWLLPVYTREFYDSLARWDRRIQRAAFKQAHLLAADHRHPSLRALPLEGLPGYYRVRVATDVRLVYRRGERQNEVEILSLIDREDLDRYIRQAKTRA